MAQGRNVLGSIPNVCCLPVDTLNNEMILIIDSVCTTKLQRGQEAGVVIREIVLYNGHGDDDSNWRPLFAFAEKSTKQCKRQNKMMDFNWPIVCQVVP